MDPATYLEGVLDDLDRKVTGATGGSSTARTTMHDGTVTTTETVPLLDETGAPMRDDEGMSIVQERPTVLVGTAPDGTHTVTHLTGTIPWTPTPPVCVGGVTALAASWDGLFLDDADTDVDESRVPMGDFLRVEVHGGSMDIPQEIDTERRSLTRLGTIETPAGGRVAVAADPGTYWVALVAVNRAGEYGDPSYSTQVEVAAPGLTPDDLDLLDAIQKSADGKNTITHSLDPANGSGSAPGDSWFQHQQNTGVVIAQWVWTGTAWEAVKLGSEVIASLDVGKLTTGVLAAGQRIIAGDPQGSHVEVTDDGLTVYRPPADGAEDRTPYATIVLGQAGKADSLQLLAADGTPVAGIDSAGRISGQSLEIAGSDTTTGSAPNRGARIYGRDFSEWLEDLPRGIVASGFRAEAHVQEWSHGDEVGLAEISFTQEDGRNYEVRFEGGAWYADVAGVALIVRLRYTSDGSSPTVTSTIADTAFAPTTRAASQASRLPSPWAAGSWGRAGSLIRVLVTVQRYYGAGAVTIRNYAGTPFATPYRFTVNDIGADVPETWIMNHGGASWAGGSPPAQTAPGAKKTYVSTWRSNYSATYNQAGARIDKAGKVQQGYYSTTNGNTKSLVYFTGGAMSGQAGLTIAQAIAGAVIQKVEVYLYAVHWYYNSGGTAVIGLLNNGSTGIPATYQGSPRAQTRSSGWPVAAGRWVTMPPDAAAAVIDGSRAVTIGPGPSTDRVFYGNFNGHTLPNPPLLRITYVK